MSWNIALQSPPGIHAWTQEGDVFQTSYVLIFLKAFFFRSLNKVPEVKWRRKGGELTFELGVEVQLEKTDGAESVAVEAQVIGWILVMSSRTVAQTVAALETKTHIKIL